jgi:hypothetical protein
MEVSTVQTDCIDLYQQIARTPACEHPTSSPAYPVRGCRFCDLNAEADRRENAEARSAGQPVPNVIGARS